MGRLSVWLRAVMTVCVLAGLSGCYSLSPIAVSDELAPASKEQTSYLVGVVGSWSGALYPPHEQRLLLRRQDDGAVAYARLRNNVFARTPRDLNEFGRGIGSVFVMPLKPGRYELFRGEFRRGESEFHAGKDFSVPFTVEPGKAYYLGDFRAACQFVRSGCMFLRTSNLPRDEALARQMNPKLPALQPLTLANIDAAFPSVIDESNPDLTTYQAKLSMPSAFDRIETLVINDDASTVVPLQPLHTPVPEYPGGFINTGDNLVMLSYVVRADGSVAQMQSLVDASPELVEQVKSTVGQWRYAPWQASAAVPAEIRVSKWFFFYGKNFRKKGLSPFLSRGASLRQPCSAINREVEALQQERPGESLNNAPSFQYFLMFSRAIGMLADVGPERSEKVDQHIKIAIPMVVERCRAEPSMAYGSVLRQALKDARAIE